MEIVKAMYSEFDLNKLHQDHIFYEGEIIIMKNMEIDNIISFCKRFRKVALKVQIIMQTDGS